MRKDLVYHYSESSITTYTSGRHCINTEPVQVQYLKGWEHETTSDPEIPPRPPCNRWTTRSPEQQTNIGEKHGDTALFNDSITSCRIPAIWKSSIVITIFEPGKDYSLRTSYRPISLHCPTAKVMEALMLTTVNTHLLSVFNQHEFRHSHSTTSALLHLTSDVETGFNQSKPPHRTICDDLFDGDMSRFL